MCLSGSEAYLTTRPQNVVVLRGQDAILNCSTNLTSSRGDNPIVWKYDTNIATYSPCSSQDPRLVAFPRDSATDCNIRSLASKGHDISGAYKCEDEFKASSHAVAYVVVLGEWPH